MSSASIYESLGLQFFRTITGIQSGPDAFDIPKLIVNFLAKLGVTEILCSFRLVNSSKSLNKGSIADLPLLRTLLTICQSSQKTRFSGSIDYSVLLAYTSLAASRTIVI